MDWGIVVNTVVILASAGGIGWIVTAREDKKAKRLENRKRDLEIEEFKKNDVLQDWKDIAEERKKRAESLLADFKELERKIDEKDKLISDLKSKLDDKNTACAVAELMKCEEVGCPNRKPPFGMRETKIADSFE